MRSCGIHMRANSQELLILSTVEFENNQFDITTASPWGQWVNYKMIPIEHVTDTALTGNPKMVPYHSVKWLQHLEWLSTGMFHRQLQWLFWQDFIYARLVVAKWRLVWKKKIFEKIFRDACKTSFSESCCQETSRLVFRRRKSNLISFRPS